MDQVAQLSTAHCHLLAAQYASSSDIIALRTLTRLRHDDFTPELLFRILLTYLPESADPSIYAEYLYEISSGTSDSIEETTDLDLSPVIDFSEAQARKRGRKINLLPLTHPSCPPDLSQDHLTLFLIHRSYRIDSETGLLNLVPDLLVPFLDHSEYLKTWFVSTLLPLVRLEYGYSSNATSLPNLAELDKLTGRKAVDKLLEPALDAKNHVGEDIGEAVASDIREIVGPWMYGDSQRKRRKLSSHRRGSSTVSVNGTSRASDASKHDWEHIFEWMVRKAETDFQMVSGAIEDWNGPTDVDFGGYDDGDNYLAEDVQSKLELRYAQAALATVYAAETDGSTKQTVKSAHQVLNRLAHFMDSLEPPPDLDAGIDMFPTIKKEALELRHLPTGVLQREALLKPDHALTTAKPESFSLLTTLIFSSYLLADLGYEISIIETTRLWLRNDIKEQHAILQAILHGLQNGPKKNDSAWLTIRNKLRWLRNWGPITKLDESQGAGIFGGLGPNDFEREILGALLTCGCHQLVLQTYITSPDSDQCLSSSEVEDVVVNTVFHHYDNASNGNRTRGGMKKASDTVAAFLPHFPKSPRLTQLSALLAATHSLSFYSLTLQHGVPFQPVSIRVSHDPVGLLEKVLAQNAHSYTKLDDLISIGQNLVAAGLDAPKHDQEAITTTHDDLSRRQLAAERRIIGMAIQYALGEDDFETAYSYVVNRLNIQPPAIDSDPKTPASPTSSLPTDPTLPDDPSWRAALAAGRYRPTNPSTDASSHLRTLNQRMDLLTHALLLAPPPSLPEILSAYRRCEEELLAALAADEAADDRFDAAVDDGNLPGAWGDDPGIRLPQQRRELGRAVGRHGAGEEAPVGLFDVARGAADAFRRNAFAGGRDGKGAGVRDKGGPADPYSPGVEGMDSEDRVRKRDMVANAVTGGLASGIGWVLGATPVNQEQQQQQQRE